jgi:hypothetical protein
MLPCVPFKMITTLMSLLPSYDQLHQLMHGKAPSPEERAIGVPIWDAAIGRAIEQLAIAKDDFLRNGELNSAAVARNLSYALGKLKTELGS